MNIRFPAVIKDIHIGKDGILATFDISPPDLSMIAELIDHEVTVTVSAHALFPTDSTTAPIETPLEPAVSGKPPSESDVASQTPSRRRSRHAGKRVK
jgi:hypothetical protein